MRLDASGLEELGRLLLLRLEDSAEHWSALEFAAKTYQPHSLIEAAGSELTSCQSAECGPHLVHRHNGEYGG